MSDSDRNINNNDLEKETNNQKETTLVEDNKDYQNYSKKDYENRSNKVDSDSINFGEIFDKTGLGGIIEKLENNLDFNLISIVATWLFLSFTFFNIFG